MELRLTWILLIVAAVNGDGGVVYRDFPFSPYFPASPAFVRHVPFPFYGHPFGFQYAVQEDPVVSVEESPVVTVEESPVVTVEENPVVSVKEDAVVSVEEKPVVSVKEVKPAIPVAVEPFEFPGHPYTYAYTGPYDPAAPAFIPERIPFPTYAPTYTTQYHSQNGLGYVYGYAGGPSAKHEEKTPDGVVRGSYSYLDGNHQLQHVSYVSTPQDGFQVVHATNTPEARVPVVAAPILKLDTLEPVEHRDEKEVDAIRHKRSAEPGIFKKKFKKIKYRPVYRKVHYKPVYRRPIYVKPKFVKPKFFKKVYKKKFFKG
ncbi:unnamed protein product [Darwinula stevensoni]|uniref:Uncharacterized protein n=1 Tax=Darwinula stevensoni TaxID=69355 RepID=A0A7R9A1B4_9CRUS|nr:unnamed protein product [Darwinula stevensoni]CAG0883108.1 unnamed protein product [Darwinula stevensoni]